MKSVFHSALSLSLLAALSVSSVTAWAAKPAGCPEGYIYLETKDANSGSDGTGFDHSSLTAQSTTEHWSDHLPPTSDKDYYVAGLQLATPNNNSVAAGTVYRFGGRTLMLDTGSTIAHCSKKDSICDLGENVIIKGGQYSFPALGTGRPCCRAQATVDGSFTFAAGSGMKTRTACYLDWNLTGGDSAKVYFTQSYSVDKDTKVRSQQTATWYWCGDCAGYTGRMVLSNGNADNVEYSILAISNSVFNGTIEVQKYERLQSFGDDAFIARAEIAEDATLDVASGHTTRIGTLVLGGCANFTTRTSKLGLTVGMTFGPSAQVSLAKDIEGAIITMPSSVAFDVETFLAAVQRGNGAARTIAAKIVDNGDGTKSVVVLNPGAVANGTLNVDDDMSIAGSDAKYRVSVAEGMTLDLINGAERMAVELKDNATLNIRRRFEDWSTIPTLWLDASAANSVSNIVVIYEDSRYNYNAGAKALKMGETFRDVNGNPFVRGWFDCRAGMQTLKLWNARYDQAFTQNSQTHNTIMYGTHPRRVLGGYDGVRDYISCDRPTPNAHVVFADGSSSDVSPSPNSLPRIYFTKYGSAVDKESDAAQKPRYAFFVFGSQQGGGASLLAGNANFLRGGTATAHQAGDPIFADNTKCAEVWLDGEAVDPTQTGFDGGWQVICVDFMSTENAFSGLGYADKNNVDNGGQNYAEIILVEQELTERQRQTIEIYLAEKWGLADKYHYPEWAKDPLATVYGTGTVKLDVDATLGGAFKGTVDLNGNNLVIDGAALPPTDAAINTANLEGWYDPDLAGRYSEGVATVKYNLAAGGTTNIVQMPSPRMYNLWDRLREWKSGDYLLYGQPQRAPWLDKSARAFGPARNWMVFENQQDPLPVGLISGSISNGKVLRFSKIVNETTGAGDGNTYQQPMQTLFMVQDSVNGGGHPFADGANVNAPVLYRSRTGTASAIGQPIYPTLKDKNGTHYTDGILTNGITCIDGREVDGTTESFGARPEVLTVVPTNTFNMVAIGQLGNSENEVNGHHEVIGEIMIYNRKLEAAERKVVEAYLSYKWLGIANAGYSALTDATVTGAGKVTAASAALLPKFAAGFTGTVSVPLDDGLAFTLATVDQATTVEGALDFGGGALEVPAGVTALTVSVAASGAKPHSGSYKLIGWAAKPAVTWNLSLDGWTREQCALRVADDGLYLDLERLGMTVIVR